MIKLYLFIVIYLLVSLSSAAQVRTISGRLTSTEDGRPLPGVSIYIKGTAQGTTTDTDGHYSLEVPIGSTLVFSFIGMTTREVIVTENNLQPAGNAKRPVKKKPAGLHPIPRSLYQDTVSNNTIGVSVLTDESPTYIAYSAISTASIRAIRKRGKTFVIQSETDPYRTGFGLQFTSSLALEQVNKLPAFQNTYSQGRSSVGSLQWQGADQQEIFSWGPSVRGLEFDGSNYPFDKNGALVPAGTGNGKKAKKYDALSFFRMGLTTINELVLILPAPKSSTLLVDLEHRIKTGIIPNTDYRKINLSASLREFKLSKSIRANATVSYNRSQGNLVIRGANLATIIGSIYRTPATFDNANGFSAKSALQSTESYMFTDGTKRTHAPGLADNPFGLVNELPDHDRLHRLIASLNVNYKLDGPFSLVLNSSIDQQWNHSVFGTPPGYSGYTNGRLTHRDDDQAFLSSLITASYTSDFMDGELKASLSHNLEYTNRNLNRLDGSGFSSQEQFNEIEEAQNMTRLDKTLTRTIQEIIVHAQYEFYNIFTARLTNRTYFSNTVNYHQFTNLFPSATLSADLVEVLYGLQVNSFKLYAITSRTLREAPLLYSNWGYGSSQMPVENYAGFYEANELFFNSSAAPETEWKFETGIKISSYGGFSAEISYFNNLTKDFIAPVNTGGSFELHNAASVKNYGGNITAMYTKYMSNGSWNISLTWGTYNNKVTYLNASQDRIALAGFQSVQSVLAQDNPVGAIYGTSYLRDAWGRKIIGNDGFPIKDANLKMIGNPIPDWTLGLSSFIRVKKVSLSFVLDFKKGGEAWNGTNSALDYLGRSENTGNLRKRTGYIFKGVNVTGDANTIPVSFYDPDAPVTTNRWTRYGWGGVGEDYIEDTSWIRLSEVVLAYTLHRAQSKAAAIREIKLSLIARNLFLITPYTGVDPSSSLFGYTTGQGLDLFNLPSTRSFSAQLTFKI